jgi:hypothetical protein
MTEHELRLLVRDAIARQLGPGHVARGGGARTIIESVQQHASHGQFPVPSGGDACIIEPSVPCSHCGYCRSWGH